jgi:hypothetical protein
MTAASSFMSFPLSVRASDAQDPGSINKASPREVWAPPRAMPGPRNQTACQVAGSNARNWRNSNARYGKFGRTDLIEIPRSGRGLCQPPMAFASDGHQFRIFPPRLGVRAGTFGSTSLGRNFASFKAGKSRERTGATARILVDMTKI